ncbi:murein biosynthesis integral membrane protein MurJ [Arhodomonas aquaeolei]|uniref:murein biosynthesis integral membrane protein MurJ n=1 Tax=Arhodomonas aquaeolei TaxID=2369 RepID=UPI0003679D90|nr:murein biosynthesis integral membrane protein MurJ [Arhodomonas aquaeolei]
MKVAGLFRALLTFSSWTLLSRVLGLVRDIVLGVVFGPSAGMDAFLVAFKIPNFMRRLFAEGAFSQAFVPVLSEYHTQSTPQEVRALVRRASGSLAVVLLAVTLVGMAASPWLVRVFAPGFAGDPERLAAAAGMLRVTFPYLMLISLTACAGAVLNSLGSFGPPAFAPVLLNICLIGAALILGDVLDPGVAVLAWAVALAGALQLALQLPFLARQGLLVMPRPDFRDPGVRRVLRLMGPTLFGTSVQQINLLVDTVLASFLMTGSISWLYWSDRLVEFPLGIFGVALGTVILPRLSRDHTGAGPEAFNATLDWALRLTLVLIVPATVGLMALAAPMLATLFQYGAFGARDVQAASFSLLTYGVGLFPFVLVKVLLPGYFARQDTRTPVRYAVVAMVVNAVFSIAAVALLYGSGVAHAGLALGTALAAGVNAGLLVRGLRRRGVYRPQAGWPRLRRQVGLAVLVMLAVLYWPARQLDAWIAAGPGLRVAALAGCIVVAAVAYFAVLLALGLRPAMLREPPSSEVRTPAG